MKKAFGLLMKVVAWIFVLLCLLMIVVFGIEKGTVLFAAAAILALPIGKVQGAFRYIGKWKLLVIVILAITGFVLVGGGLEAVNSNAIVSDENVLTNEVIVSTEVASEMPTMEPTATPTVEPTATPTVKPTATPTVKPTATPTVKPTATPTEEPTATPTVKPTATPTVKPTATPTVEPTEEPETYVLNKGTRKFHYMYCNSVDDIKEKNYSEYTGTREEVIRKGYEPCGRCDP